MIDKEYRQHEGISRSELWRLRESPEKFKWAQEHPEPPAPALVFGQAVHKLLLEPETFDDEFIVWDNSIKKTTTAGKAAWKEFEQSIGEKTVLNMYDSGQTFGYLTALNMTTAAKNAPFVDKLLNGEHEKPLFWADEMTGEACKVRLDCLTEIDGRLTVIDYKTTTNASTHKFNRSIFNYGYHFQAAMYCEAVKQALKLGEMPDFIFIAQEKAAPYAINVVTVPEDVVLNGYDVFRELLGIYHECKETGCWYGYNGAFNEPNEAYLLEWVKHESDLDE